MGLLPSIDIATRLTREGKLAEALAALGGGVHSAKPGPVWPSRHTTSAGGASLKTAFDAGLGALGRLGAPVRFDRGGTAPASSPSGAGFTEHDIGGLAYKLYRPAKAGAEPQPLVVMLHGCTQSPDDFAAGTRMNEWAEREGFTVAYPAQSRAANAQKCWNWFRAIDQGRSGEPALVVGMVDDIAAHHAIDRTRIYVAGLSAGGAAAAVLGQTYPDVFAAVGVHSGLACGAAADMATAFGAMQRGATGPLAGAGIPTIVFHGDRDTTVAPVNGTQVLAQAEPAGQLVTNVENARSANGMDYTRTVQTDAAGLPQSEHWLLHGAGHAWAGGDPAGSYTDPRGPDATAAMLRFFRHHARQNA